MKESKWVENSRNCLARTKEHPLSEKERSLIAIELAGWILEEARLTQKPKERRLQNRLASMMRDPVGKLFIVRMTDQCFRSQKASRVADQLIFLINTLGIPHFFSFFEKIQLMAFKIIGKPLANILVPLVKYMVRKETSSVILPGEPNELAKHIRERRREAVRINLNHLGEAILGEEEAKHRLDIYLKDLANPDIEYISIKISTIYSQINLLGWEDTLAILSERLKKLYRAAKNHVYVRTDGTKVHKFVNLDMEEYRDLHPTVELFRQVLDDPEFFEFSAGIVLQSYLPDSFLIQQELTEWAMDRIQNGGSPIKIRIVKGANLAMEKLEASHKGWEAAPYSTKAKVDANFKSMLLYGCHSERVKAVILGVASHNLFDIAYTLLLRAEYSLEKYIHFEMLEGMADHIRRVVQNISGDILLYCPVATHQEFQNAVAYLMRRLDENTAPENFLRHAFEMKLGTKIWDIQSELFINACQEAKSVSHQPNRSQNRLEPILRRDFHSSFANEIDTDWTNSANRSWAESILLQWLNKRLLVIPLVLGNQTITETSEGVGEGEDPSFPGIRFYRYTVAGKKELEIALETSIHGFKTWSSKPLEERLILLDEVAYTLREQRADLIGSIVSNVGKTVAEADNEVSEAIDFADYYRHMRQELQRLDDISLSPKGPVLVAPPWNFPCSIGAGGILAALAAGNSVIFKPAPEAVLVGWQLVNAFWKAGISKEILQFFCCLDEPIGSCLVQDPRISVVILTGATGTAKLMIKLRPTGEIIAETGGKNALIVSSMADRDLAVKDIVQSAFSFSGQKCSACSLVILEEEVYNDPKFKKQLYDAVASLKLGSPWELSTRVNPLIHFPNPSLLRGLTTLEDGEEWLLKPVQDPDNQNLWSPGIKYGVKPGSFSQTTELFGPVLSVMCAKNIPEAITIANSTPYGLTGGLHSLDDREQQLWLDQIIVGNGYINRGITGAIVQRQPFGGCKESCFGFGSKTGGPNYILQLMNKEQIGLPKELEIVSHAIKTFESKINKSLWTQDDIEIWNTSLGSYTFYYNTYFSKKHDPSQVLGQDNLLCYVPQFNQTVRIQQDDCLNDLLRVIVAAIICLAPLEISFSKEQAKIIPEKVLDTISNIHFIEENEQQFIERLSKKEIKRVRLLSKANHELLCALASMGCNTIKSGVLANGRIELLHYLREVSMSIDFHRYGYLGEES